VVGKHEALSSKSKYCQNKQTNRMPGPLWALRKCVANEGDSLVDGG
jgi:hypothetical protein